MMNPLTISIALYFQSYLIILFKLDSVHKSFSFCFEEKIEKCKKLQGENPSLHALCVVGGFYHCVWDMHPMDPLHGMVENVELLCLKI
jgi:hypothetical protein